MATAQLTSDNGAIVAELFIAAPPARVFEAFADCKQLAQRVGTERCISSQRVEVRFSSGRKTVHRGQRTGGPAFSYLGRVS